MSTATTWDNDPFGTDERASAPSLSFPTPGTTYEGKVLSIESDVQGYVYNRDPAAPKVKAVWPSGDPKLSIVITLEIDTGAGVTPQAFWVTKYKKNARHQAIVAAQEALGRPMAEGDVLKVAYTGNDPDNPDRKLFRAKITPGVADHFATKKDNDDDEPPF